MPTWQIIHTTACASAVLGGDVHLPYSNNNPAPLLALEQARPGEFISIIIIINDSTVKSSSLMMVRFPHSLALGSVVGRMRRRVGLAVAAIFAVCLSLALTITLPGGGRHELLDASRSPGEGGGGPGGVSLSSSLEAQKEALERKIAADEASAAAGGSEGIASGISRVGGKNRCGRLCKAKKAILKVKGELDSRAKGSLQMLVSRRHQGR